jgi:multisubunit Na+/H+ antiporter MnhE subunit
MLVSFSALTASALRESIMTSGLRHPLLFGASIVLAPTLWVLFTGNMNPHEVFLGGCACIASITFTVYVCRSSSKELTLLPRDVIQFWRIPWYIISGTYQVTLLAFQDTLHWKQAEDLYRVCGFDTSLHDPVRRARTVLATAFTTAGPSFIVIGVDPAQSRMIFHQIESSMIPKMTKALGAKS